MPGREPSIWSTRNTSATTALILASVLLAGCANSNQQAGSRLTAPLSGPDVIAEIREVDLRPRFPQPVKSSELPNPDAGSRGASYYGDASPGTTAGRPGSRGRSAEPDSSPETTGSLAGGSKAEPGDKGYELNFENAPVATAAKAVLGDILGFGYTIDPRVQGTVSISSGRPVPKTHLVFVLESALRAINVALVRDGQSYRIVPSGEATGTGSIDGAGGVEPGYGISVVPLHYVSAQTLIKLLENFAAKPGMARADLSRNLLIIQGNGADRRTAIETALSFDADWMRGQSVGIYPVSNSTPEPIISELERIIDAGEGGLGQNVVKLQPIARQNSILVVTRKPELLKKVSTWIARLDKAGTAGTGMRVYRMRYGDATQVATLLNDVFLGSSASGLDTPANQLVPGGGMVSTSSDRPSTGSGQAMAAAASVRGAGGSQQAPDAIPARFDAGGGIFSRTAGAAAAGRGRGGAQGASVAQGHAGPLLPNVRIAPDVTNNALLIYADQENYRLIERTLQQLDRPQLQVAIDATIAEITLNDELRYGVQFFLKSKDVGLKGDTGSILNTALNVAGGALLSRVLPGFNFLMGSETDPRLVIDALHAVTDVKILSTPSVVVVDNKFATLQVGDEIPIITRTARSVENPTAPVVNNIDYRNTGVILRVAPRINANGNVLLDIEQEISAVANTSTADTLTPTVSQRRVSSSIAVASGQTVLLGGLISERHDRGRRGVPGLHQIPGFGELFARTSGTAQRTELIILIRPQIIRNGIDAARIAQELRAKMRGGYEGGSPTPRAVIGKTPLPPPRK